MSEDSEKPSADVCPFTLPEAARVNLVALEILAKSDERAAEYWHLVVAAVEEAKAARGFGPEVARWQVAELRKAVDAENCRIRAG
ncbi:MAG: DUF6074 family protein [Aurantimonas endophytica]|uniref:DUF6074 family protein n=1 Tax=Aurantimonas endophytica TaxID=1522175 RepID=UPI003002B2F5